MEDTFYVILYSYTSVLGGVRWCKSREEIYQTINFLNDYLSKDINTWDSSEFEREIVKINFFKRSSICDYNNYKFALNNSIENLVLLKRFFTYIIEDLKDKSMEQIQDFLDAIHAFPSAIINKRWNPVVYWNIYLLPYSNKWDEKFEENVINDFSN
ncbi:MAG: hypothetical protein A2Y15_04380 [Clostridiales bacterium GWF2_36_10]|nr:MAG: hypothetical protein A2Y15_04380 [Clostridiales bacterium GWF2_36_10]HAN20489.1 hypothetical protein [Clostridiales bacterium]